MLNVTAGRTWVCLACQSAFYDLPCLLPIAARLTTPRMASSTMSKRTLRNCDTAKACRTLDQRSTERVGALPRHQNVCTSSHRFDQRAMTISCSPLQMAKENPRWPPLKRGGWKANVHDPWCWMSWLHVGHKTTSPSIVMLWKVP